jgi:proteic killer suppression protein
MSSRVPPGNRLEALKGDWKEFHSIRINDQRRVVFQWSGGNAFDVQIVDWPSLMRSRSTSNISW